MKDIYVDGKKLARNGRKTATYFAASFFLIIEGFYFRICCEEINKQKLTVESIVNQRSSFMSQIFCKTEVKIDQNPSMLI